MGSRTWLCTHRCCAGGVVSRLAREKGDLHYFALAENLVSFPRSLLGDRPGLGDSAVSQPFLMKIKLFCSNMEMIIILLS